MNFYRRWVSDTSQNMPRYLTKSRFKLAVECPTKLFYTGKDSEYRNLNQEDTFLQSLADGGFQVGKMATLLYPEGREITARSNEEAVQETEGLLAANDNITLFEPAIRYGQLFIRIDILVKQGNVFELIEVKAKSYDSKDPQIVGAKGGIKSGMLPYIQDVAFQRYVLQNAYPNSNVVSFLMMPDKAKRASIDGLNQLFKVRRNGQRAEVVLAPNAATQALLAREILCKVPVDQHADIVMREGIEYPGGRDTLPILADYWSQVYEKDEKIPPVLHKGCANCEYREASGGEKKSGFHECLIAVTKMARQEIDRGTILDIWHYRKKDDLLNRGVYRYSDVHDEDIDIKDDKDGLSRSQRQWMQVRGIPKEMQAEGFYLDRALINHQMDRWTYPLHMIDFETATVALPFFSGMRPYESIAFQFSHHVIERDGTVRHVGQFLSADPGVFPNFELVRALKRELEGDDGTIFRWATHENTILNHIGRQLQESVTPPADRDQLLTFIESITKGRVREMVDLAVVTERAYFHPDTKARTSIKKVLSVVLKTSPYLKKKYEKPVYGVNIPSLNYRGFSWWSERDGVLIDPYERLKELSKEMLGDAGSDQADLEALDVDIEIAEGGAAAMAFARLQFEDLAPQTREKIKAALLRYCELDTLAMVMIVEAWREWSR